MLKLVIASAVVALPQCVLSHTFDLGYISVPGACASSNFPSRSGVPWANQRNLSSQDGKFKISITVLPSRDIESQSEVQQKLLADCVKASARDLPKSEEAFSDPRLEDQVTEQINACLSNRRATFSVRFGTLRRGRIECGKLDE